MSKCPIVSSLMVSVLVLSACIAESLPNGAGIRQSATSCLVTATTVGPIKLGASTSDVISALSAQYAVENATKPNSVTTLVVRARSGGNPRFVIQLTANSVFLIDSYENCKTQEGIGLSDTLAMAEEQYGEALISPTDIGYFVSFQRKSGIEFLLDEKTLPERLRSIPDDALTPQLERDIRSVSTAKIIAVRVSRSF